MGCTGAKPRDITGSPAGDTEKPIKAYGGIGFDGEIGSAKVAEDLVRRGFKGVKAKIGSSDVMEDLKVIRAIRAAVGGSVAIMVNYNQCLTPAEAVERLRVLDGERAGLGRGTYLGA